MAKSRMLLSLLVLVFVSALSLIGQDAPKKETEKNTPNAEKKVEVFGYLYASSFRGGKFRIYINDKKVLDESDLKGDFASKNISLKTGDIIRAKANRSMAIAFVSKDKKKWFSTTKNGWSVYLPENEKKWWIGGSKPEELAPNKNEDILAEPSLKSLLLAAKLPDLECIYLGIGDNQVLIKVISKEDLTE